jgi:acetylornithine/succinyldiaminopimelate/putrescine aminotransferase
MRTRHPLFDTWDEMIEGEIPNFLRLFLNPAVAQTCLCLERYVQNTWYADEQPAPAQQTFLANGFDEALSGAIKLARFAAHQEDRPRAGLVCDPDGRLGPLVSYRFDSLARVDFIPDLVVVGKEGLDPREARQAAGPFGFLLLFPSAGHAPALALDTLLAARPAPLVILCVDRPGLTHCQRQPTSPWRRLRPDVVVFDESFARRHVPFGAFTARKTLYDYWNRRGYATFHSTTFQPNALTSLHFLRCLQAEDPAFFARLANDLERAARDLSYCRTLFARVYSPSLARTAAAVGWDTADVRAAGHYVTVNGQAVFDGVAGVACSIRGHNPAGFREDIEKLALVTDYHEAAVERLRRLTGLGHLVPAVSGASAVEHALRLGLTAQFPRKYVLALGGGFGGKTLLALAGTAKPSYKVGLDPLYPHVLYVDPFRASALDDLEKALQDHPVAVVQLEVIQAVGGVRPVPEKVVHYLHEQKERLGYFLFVDEIQTGMYRTGPFVRSHALGIEPDLLTIGKGTSDMMFPFAATLYSSRVADGLRACKAHLPEALRSRFDYEFGYKTLINVLDQAAAAQAEEHVRQCGEQFARLLGEGLAGCKAVRDVRVFGLLIGIELDTQRWPRRWLGNQQGPLVALNLLGHAAFPLLCGFCQYEPHVLKLTPPLSITLDEIPRVCDTLVSVLRRPVHKLLPALVRAQARAGLRAWRIGHGKRTALPERLAR